MARARLRTNAYSSPPHSNRSPEIADRRSGPLIPQIPPIRWHVAVRRLYLYDDRAREDYIEDHARLPVLQYFDGTAWQPIPVVREIVKA